MLFEFPFLFAYATILVFWVAPAVADIDYHTELRRWVYVRRDAVNLTGAQTVDECRQLREKNSTWRLPNLDTYKKNLWYADAILKRTGSERASMWIGLIRDKPNREEIDNLNITLWRDPSKWRWTSDNSTLAASLETLWEKSQPDNKGLAEERCVVAEMEKAQNAHNHWFDWPCNASLIKNYPRHVLVCESDLVSTIAVTSIDGASSKNPPGQAKNPSDEKDDKTMSPATKNFWFVFGSCMFIAIVCAIAIVVVVVVRKNRRRNRKRRSMTMSTTDRQSSSDRSSTSTDQLIDSIGFSNSDRSPKDRNVSLASVSQTAKSTSITKSPTSTTDVPKKRKSIESIKQRKPIFPMESKESTPKKTTPKKTSPKKSTPKKSTPKKSMPKISTPNSKSPLGKKGKLDVTMKSEASDIHRYENAPYTKLSPKVKALKRKSAPKDEKKKKANKSK